MILFFGSLQIKGIVVNEKKKLFLMNGDFFSNVKKCIIPRRSLVTVHALTLQG